MHLCGRRVISLPPKRCEREVPRLLSFSVWARATLRHQLMQSQTVIHVWGSALRSWSWPMSSLLLHFTCTLKWGWWGNAGLCLLIPCLGLSPPLFLVGIRETGFSGSLKTEGCINPKWMRDPWLWKNLEQLDSGRSRRYFPTWFWKIQEVSPDGIVMGFSFRKSWLLTWCSWNCFVSPFPSETVLPIRTLCILIPKIRTQWLLDSFPSWG